MTRTARRTLALCLAALCALAMTVTPASALPTYDFATPVFGLAARGETLFVADAGAGIVKMTADKAKLAVPLPGVTDVVPLKRGRMWAVTSGPKNKKLWFVARGKPRFVANLGAFERRVNPDPTEVDSNPFDLARIGKDVLVADAGANAILVASRDGTVDWVATLPAEDAPTAHAKQLVGCPNPDEPDLAFVCELPDTIPAEAVTTSVAIGPDGAYYVSELKGFPGPLGMSRIWRVEPGTRQADCASSDSCSVVADGFTSIVDLSFGADGSAYVVEIDEDGFLAVELGGGTGGTVNHCNTTTTPLWTCTELETGLTIPIAAVETASGSVFAAVGALIPGQAAVVELTG